MSSQLTDLNENDRERILTDLFQSIPGFTMRSKPVRLTGGLLNFVWRVEGTADSTYPSLIAKWVPPYVSSNPAIQLDPGRIRIEANALKTLGLNGALAHLTNEKIRVPAFVLLDSDHNILVMEDVCNCPDLSQWVKSEHQPEETYEMGKRIGAFIGSLHRVSADRQDLAQQFLNPQIQRTRLDVLYGNIGLYAQRANLPEAVQMAEIARAYGELLQTSGKAVIMGDLWLPSVIVSSDGLQVIDWELAHYGRPSQDVGHLAAHLWMHMHRPPTEPTADNARTMLRGFLTQYRAALGDDYERLFGAEGSRESSIHFGSEILARTVGFFQEGYLYQGLAWDHSAIQQAARMAARHITSVSADSIFGLLLI